jgi:exopolyphosphatase/guanosine-5'-triphosphate,3'-diphosphate pyrophosphatase
MRTAVIDIGTNTLLLLIVERGADGTLAPLVDLCRFGKLGRGLDKTRQLHPESIAQSLEICREYRRVMDAHGVTRVLPIATQAAREATNAADFVGPAEAILGASIEIIAGQREAELAFASVTHTFPELAGSPYLVVDVGGGSTEFIATTDGATIAFARSIPIGARRMTERHLASDPPTAAELAACAADIDRQIAELPLPTGVPIVGTAGTATTIASIELGLVTYDPVRVTGLRLAPATVVAQLARLAATPVAARGAVAGLPAERADVIVAGIAIYARALLQLSAPTFITCDRGIRWGVAYTA